MTYLLTDIEGSTLRWEADPSAMRAAMTRHDAIIGDVLRSHGGVAVEAGREGDSVLAVFGRAADAALAALETQAALAAEPWPAGLDFELRMALHTGEAELRGGHYYGQALYRCARLLAAGNGGQVLVSQATQQLLVDDPPGDALLLDLGEHRLKDLRRPERIFQLTAPGLATNTRLLRTLDLRMTNLPVSVSSFLGRDEQLAELATLLQSCRLLTLTGAGGSGKTSLAYHLTAEVLHDHPDGAWVVELGGITDPVQVASAVATGLQVLELPRRTLTDSIVESLRRRRLLVLLDNCEHLIDAVAELSATILTTCPGTKVLATSRESLGIAGEVTWRVPSLGAGEAHQLFCERARQHRTDLILAPDDPVIAEICHRLDGIPLAIELAAAQVVAFTVEQIRVHLANRFRLLSMGTRTAPPRQRTLEATVNWSYELLNPSQRALLRRLSVFAGSFDLEGAEMVADADVVPAIAELVRKSLLTADSGRYRILETIREFAARRLTESGDEADARSRLASYILDLAKRRRPGETAVWLDRLMMEHDNVRSALEFSSPDARLRLAGAVFEFWYLRGHLSEGRKAIEIALVRASRDAPERAISMVELGALTYDQGEYEAARDILGQALALARSTGDSQATGRGLHILGLVELVTGNPVAAGACFKEALGIWQHLGDRSQEAEIFHQLGVLAGARSDNKTAQELFARSLSLRRRAGLEDETQLTLTFAAAVALASGELEKARGAMKESLELGRRLGDRRLAWSLDVCACLAATSGVPERALRLAGAALAMHEASGVTPAEMWGALLTAYLDPARERLGAKAADSALAAGRGLTYADAIDFALATLG